MSDLRLKPCTRCRRLFPVAQGRSLCSECESKRLQERKEARDYRSEYLKRSESEDKRLRKFYKSKEWRNTSLAYQVSAGHRSEECGALGTDVHHVVPVQTPEGWKRRFDPSNLRLLCVGCHNRAHGRTFGGGHGKEQDADVRPGEEQAGS